MNAVTRAQNWSSSPEHCTVLVIYDDNPTRARVLAACDYLVNQHWENVELDFHWWRTDFLQDTNMALAAAYYAKAADFLIVCSGTSEGMSDTLETWFGSWIAHRENRQGVLIDLTPATTDSPWKPHQETLQLFAERAHLDYLTTLDSRDKSDPRINLGDASLPGLISMDTRRLRQTYPPSHYGLNE